MSRVLLSALLLLSWSAAPSLAKDKGPCAKPPEIVQDKPPDSPEDAALARKIKEKRVYATIAFAIDEVGNVMDVRVVRASSAEAGEYLARKVAKMRFGPRSGCGTFRTQMTFDLHLK
jgi:hypothetical protein